MHLQHANADDVTKQMAKRQAGKVQGTDADLRRMTTAQARERLRYVLSSFHHAQAADMGMPRPPCLAPFYLLATRRITSCLCPSFQAEIMD